MGGERRLRPRPVEEIKALGCGDAGQRKAAQPTNKRTFGSVFKNPRARVVGGTDARSSRASRAPDRRRADLAQARELHRERRRHDRFTAIELMTEARRRALEEFGVELEHDAAVRAYRAPGRGAGGGSDPRRAKLAPHVRLGVPVLRRSRPRSPACNRLRAPCRSLRPFFAARETAVFAVHDVEVESIPNGQSRSVGQGAGKTFTVRACSGSTEEIQRRLDKLPHVHLLGYDRAFPNSLRIKVSVERPVAVARRGDEELAGVGRGRVPRPLSVGCAGLCLSSGSSAPSIHMWARSWELRNRRERSGPSP